MLFEPCNRPPGPSSRSTEGVQPSRDLWFSFASKQALDFALAGTDSLIVGNDLRSAAHHVDDQPRQIAYRNLLPEPQLITSPIASGASARGETPQRCYPRSSCRESE